MPSLTREIPNHIIWVLMNYFREEILVILNDCVIDRPLIGGYNTINAKVGDKVFPPVKVG
jgi:hypothetical protein